MKRCWPAKPIPGELLAEVQALVPRLLGPGVRVLQTLAGGHRNLVLAVGDEAGPSHVLKLFAENADAAALEAAIRRRLGDAVHIPEMVVETFTRDGHPTTVGLMPFIPGTSGYAVLERPTSERRALAGQIGEALACIHAIEFSQGGFLDANLDVIRPLDLSGSGLVTMMEASLGSERVRARVASDSARRLLRQAERWCPRLDELASAPKLAHGDFGPENLRWDDDGELWVLDWEFAHSGASWIDLGHMLRPEVGDDAAIVAGFVRGYEATAGPLPAHWRSLASLVDSLAWLEFLDRPTLDPVVLGDALTMLEKHLVLLER